ncbi:hypothetical protein ABTJ98_20595, partial [Acinetobacter baumannii]
VRIASLQAMTAANVEVTHVACLQVERGRSPPTPRPTRTGRRRTAGDLHHHSTYAHRVRWTR